MKRSFLIVILLCFAIHSANAQLWKLRRWEAEFGIGPSLSFPDIGGFSIGDNFLGFRDISYRQTRFGVNGSLRYRLSRTVNTRLDLTYAMLHATDVRGSNEGRKYESMTNLFEPAVMVEYYLVKNKYESSYLFLRGKSLWALLSSLDFYAFAGIGGASFSVKGNDALIERGMKDSGFCAVIPGGVGATLIYTPNLNFGLELGGRYAFTDYLDGYHSVQYSKARDVYYLLNFTVTYKLKTSPKGLPSFR
jgi:opacity protein-like surface antigen